MVIFNLSITCYNPHMGGIMKWISRIIVILLIIFGLYLLHMTVTCKLPNNACGTINSNE